MKNYFSFLPGIDDGIMFVDNCSFYNSCLDSNGRPYHPNLKERLKKDTWRFSQLVKKLSRMENWVTIKEVAEEFKNGFEGLEEIKYFDSIYHDKEMTHLLNKTIRKRKQTYKLLIKEERNATKNLPEGLAEKIKSFLLPKAEEIFQKTGGKLSKAETDCKLVAAALAFAHELPTYMFSRDKPLLFTYSILSKILGKEIQETYIINEIIKSKVGKK